MGLLKQAVSYTRPAAARLSRRYSTALASDLPDVANMPALPPARPSLATEVRLHPPPSVTLRLPLPPPHPALSATQTFDWQDPLALSASLSDEENAIFETARSFAQQELKPNIVEANRAGHFDRGIMRQFGQMGLLGLTVPAQCGGG